MSLFNNVEAMVKKNLGITKGARKSSPSGILDAAGIDTGGMSPFGAAAAGMAANVAMNAGSKLAKNLVNKFIPANIQAGFGVAKGMIGDYNKAGDEGGLGGVGLGLMSKYGSMVPGQSSVASQTKYWRKKIPLWGGITPVEAAEIYDDMQSFQNKFAKKNLFLVQVKSKYDDKNSTSTVISKIFNMFVTELDYAPFTLIGEKRKVGSASIDSVQASEPVTLRITTIDDINGTIKKWFFSHVSAAANADGTVGVPDDYAIEFKIYHSVISETQATDKKMMTYKKDGTEDGWIYPSYRDIGLFRPANLEFNLSRREDGLQEIQMTFEQLDTFMTY